MSVLSLKMNQPDIVFCQEDIRDHHGLSEVKPVPWVLATKRPNLTKPRAALGMAGLRKALSLIQEPHAMTVHLVRHMFFMTCFAADGDTHVVLTCVTPRFSETKHFSRRKDCQKVWQVEKLKSSQKFLLRARFSQPGDRL